MKSTFDKQLFIELSSVYEEGSEIPYKDFILKAGFSIGSFILPKYLIKGFEIEKDKEDSKAVKMILKNFNDGSFTVVKNG